MKTFIKFTCILLLSGCAATPQPLATETEIRRLVNAYESYCFNPIANNQNIQLLAHANQLKTIQPSGEPGLSELHSTLNINGIPWAHQPVVYELIPKSPQQRAIYLSTFLPDTCIVSMKMNPKSLYDLILYLGNHYDANMINSTRRGDLLIKVFTKMENQARLEKARKNNEEIKSLDKIMFTFSYLYDQQTVGLTYLPLSTAIELITVRIKEKLGDQQSSADHPVKSIMYQLNEKNPPSSGL